MLKAGRGPVVHCNAYGHQTNLARWNDTLIHRGQLLLQSFIANMLVTTNICGDVGRQSFLSGEQ